jgi:hypothetical protein
MRQQCGKIEIAKNRKFHSGTLSNSIKKTGVKLGHSTKIEKYDIIK